MFIYLIKDDKTGWYKLGRTGDVERRKKTLEQISLRSLELVAVERVRDAIVEETRLHKIFADKRRVGEWFELSEAEVLFALKYFDAVKVIEEVVMGNFYECVCARKSCEHNWIPRTPGQPKMCPRCKGKQIISRVLVLVKRVCQKCGHNWTPNGGKYPTICPKCKTRYWDGREQGDIPIKPPNASVGRVLVESGSQFVHRIEVVECCCSRCEHCWRPNGQENLPVMCPRCKSKYWNQVR